MTRPAMIAATLLASAGGVVHADLFRMESWGIAYNQQADAYEVTVVFNQPPQFWTMAYPYNRPVHGWCFNFYWDEAAAWFYEADAGLRVEIPLEEPTYRLMLFDLRSQAVIGYVPFVLTDCTMTFSLPRGMMADSDNLWVYRIWTFDTSLDWQNPFIDGLESIHRYPDTDLDDDGDVDQDDLTLFYGCAAGAAIPPPAECEGKDFDQDGDVDQSDFGILQCFLNG